MAEFDCTNVTYSDCAEVHEFPYSFCCLHECGEHEFCRGCDKGIYLKKGE